LGLNVGVLGFLVVNLFSVLALALRAKTSDR